MCPFQYTHTNVCPYSVDVTYLCPSSGFCIFRFCIQEPGLIKNTLGGGRNILVYELCMDRLVSCHCSQVLLCDTLAEHVQCAVGAMQAESRVIA